MRRYARKSIVYLMFLSLAACKSLNGASSLHGSQASSQTTDLKYPITIFGSDEAAFTPAITGNTVKDPQAYDAIVVGGGLAGLSAAIYLSDQGQRVLLVEKEKHLGGLAAGSSTQGGARFDRGAAYWTDAYKEEAKILERIGLKDYHQKNPIPEPIDSYYWNGKLFEGIWEDATLAKLPASFELFRQEMRKADKAGQIPNQPMEEAEISVLDNMSALDWIKQMPSLAKARVDPQSRKVFKRFESDQNVNKNDRNGMGDVIDLIDLYCRSALGTTSDAVSAMAFANFYISELDPRFTSPIGTGQAAENMTKILTDAQHNKLVTMKTQSPVGRIVDDGKQVKVTYVSNGAMHEAEAPYAVFAAQLKFAPRLIEGFAAKDPQRAQILNNMRYSHYSVHNVFIKGHPYRATYDTWTRAKDFSVDDFTDVILGRWMDPKMLGYEGYRDFSKDPSDDEGILTIYHPLGQKWIGTGYTDKDAGELAERAVDRMIELYTPLAHGPIEVKSVQTSRWPFSVHVAAPGHFTKLAKILRKPFGRIFFANNNIGTPAFEEALFRGHCAANNIMKRVKPNFKNESWSNCPLE